MSAGTPLRIDLGYHGKHFYGSQRQASVRTVQEELEAAVQQVTGRETALAFAGRTDRGVHAVGQVASGRVDWHGEFERLRYALDSVTAADIVIYRVSEVSRDFHARFSAVRRSYRYRVFVSDRAPVLTVDAVNWVRDRLDQDRLNQASERLIGKHDFRSFAGKGLGSGEQSQPAIRAMNRAEWRELPESLEPNGQLLEFRIDGNAFLPHMVRNMVGALIEVGAGRQETDWITSLLALHDRRQAPPPAPAKGLVLWNVEYE